MEAQYEGPPLLHSDTAPLYKEPRSAPDHLSNSAGFPMLPKPNGKGRKQMAREPMACRGDSTQDMDEMLTGRDAPQHLLSINQAAGLAFKELQGHWSSTCSESSEGGPGRPSTALRRTEKQDDLGARQPGLASPSKAWTPHLFNEHLLCARL